MGTAFGDAWAFIPLAALLIDFVITVAISCAAGASAIIAYVPALEPGRVILALGLTALVAGGISLGHHGRIAFAAATHNATLAVLLMLVAAGALVALFNRTIVPWAGILRGGLALALGAALLVAANYVVTRRVAWTPGGIALMFGRMLNDAQTNMGRAPTLAIFPGLGLAAIVLGINLLGDGLRDLLDPRSAREPVPV